MSLIGLLKNKIKNDLQEENILTVSELTSTIKELLESSDGLKNISVRGELSNLTQHTSGHIYFTLKDEESQISCAFFRGWNQNLKFKLEHGMKVVLKGSIEVYSVRGNYQIVVREILQDGVGELHKKFLLLKEKLNNEGLFDAKYKKDLPIFPNTIGIVTSLDGAVLHDMVNIIKSRWPFVEIVIAPAKVQGIGAAPTIVEGIELLNQLNVDVIIIGRGGGSLEELWCFNEESVARGIFKSKIPIISAVGHETDFSISDFVADKRAATPSNAAELIVPDIDDIRKQIELKESMLFNGFKQFLHQNYQYIDAFEQRINKSFESEIKFLLQEFEHTNTRLNDLNPKATLKRGYSVVMKKGEIVKSVKTLEKGDIINTILHEGEVESIVERTR